MISCEIGTGTTYVNIHEKTGLAVPPNAPLAMREAMRRMLDNPEEVRKFGDNAKARFERMFSSEKMCASTAEIYQDVLKTHKECHSR